MFRTPNTLKMNGKIESLSRVIKDVKTEPKANFRNKKKETLNGWIQEQNGDDREKSW